MWKRPVGGWGYVSGRYFPVKFPPGMPMLYKDTILIKRGHGVENSGINEQEIVLFIESKDAVIPRGLPSGQYRIKALQLLNRLSIRNLPYRETSNSQVKRPAGQSLPGSHFSSK
jgi:hypothetical protein